MFSGGQEAEKKLQCLFRPCRAHSPHRLVRTLLLQQHYWARDAVRPAGSSSEGRQRSSTDWTDRSHEDPLLEAFRMDQVSTRRHGERHSDDIVFACSLFLLGREDVNARQADRAVWFGRGGRTRTGRLARLDVAGHVAAQVGNDRGRKRARVIIPRREGRQLEPLREARRNEEARAARAERREAEEESGLLMLRCRNTILEDEDEGLAGVIGGEVPNFGWAQRSKRQLQRPGTPHDMDSRDVGTSRQLPS